LSVLIELSSLKLLRPGASLVAQVGKILSFGVRSGARLLCGEAWEIANGDEAFQPDTARAVYVSRNRRACAPVAINNFCRVIIS
jgi:hypothetical protein